MAEWLPRGFLLDNGVTAGRLLSAGPGWQLYSASDRGQALAAAPALYEKWDGLAVLPSGLFRKTETPSGEVFTARDGPDGLIASVKHGPYPSSFEETRDFAAALKRSRAALPSASFDDAVYFKRHALLLPTYGGGDRDDQTILCTWIAGGVSLSLDRFDRLREIVSWMPPNALEEVIRAAGFPVPRTVGPAMERSRAGMEPAEKAPAAQNAAGLRVPAGHFSLPGRPALEAFFNEHIIDIVRNSERYKRMGIDFPAAVILYGPPGCGKTFAVERLTEFLGWPVFSVNGANIGSPYIHETSRKISEMFDQAIDSAPSVLVIDEMEAFLSARDTSHSSGQLRVEEVAEFLRRIPEAREKHVLIIAMTNMIEAIDQAILRRGRFDHILEVTMPAREEVDALLRHLFSTLPVSDDIDHDEVSSRLQGCALSDVTFVVKEAGRLAVRENKDMIDNDLLRQALEALPKKKESMRKIGF